MLIMGPSGMPAVIGLFIGIIMGDPAKAVMIGAMIQVMYLGVVHYGGTMPVDQFFASIIAIPISISTGMDDKQALALAAAFGALGVAIDTIWKTLNTSAWGPYVDRACEKLQYGKISRGSTLFPILTRILLSTPIIFLILYVGTDAVNWLMDNLPQWLLIGFSNMGAIIPAMGFAMFITILGRPLQIPFFIIGFYIMRFGDIPIIGMAVFGAFLAFLSVLWGDPDFFKNRGQA
ncbi:hypothetical protein RV10_GL001295 [Enterococcus pallens]|nr:hypothetical protein RV10_GL001295 [Enterococcus pallens]